jgi:hypothetical protein
VWKLSGWGTDGEVTRLDGDRRAATCRYQRRSSRGCLNTYSTGQREDEDAVEDSDSRVRHAAAECA